MEWQFLSCVVWTKSGQKWLMSPRCLGKPELNQCRPTHAYSSGWVTPTKLVRYDYTFPFEEINVAGCKATFKCIALELPSFKCSCQRGSWRCHLFKLWIQHKKCCLCCCDCLTTPVSLTPRSRRFTLAHCILLCRCRYSEHYVGHCSINFSVGLHIYCKRHCKSCNQTQKAFYVAHRFNRWPVELKCGWDPML